MNDERFNVSIMNVQNLIATQIDILKVGYNILGRKIRDVSLFPNP